MDKLLYKKFDEIYTKHFNNVCYFCTSYLDDAELGKDVAQEVFVSIWDRMEKIDTDSYMLPYLITLAKNKCINILTKEKVRKKYNTSRALNMMDEVNAFALHEMSASNLYRKEIGMIYEKALSKMPKKTRETFVQIRIHGSKYKELAEKQNISVKSLEYHITQATLILRKNFRDYLKILAVIVTTTLKHLYE